MKNILAFTILLAILLSSCEKLEFKNDIEGSWKIELISGGQNNLVAPNYDHLQFKNSNYIILRDESTIEKGSYSLNKFDDSNYYKWYIHFNVDYNHDPTLTFDNSCNFFIDLISNDTLILSQKDIADGMSYYYTKY
jgi:hypothetical protein